MNYAQRLKYPEKLIGTYVYYRLTAKQRASEEAKKITAFTEGKLYKIESYEDGGLAVNIKGDGDRINYITLYGYNSAHLNDLTHWILATPATVAKKLKEQEHLKKHTNY